MSQILVLVGLLTVEINSIPYIILSSYNVSESDTEEPASKREGVLMGREISVSSQGVY